MQVQNIAIDLQMMYSAVNDVMRNLVPANCSVLCAFGSKRLELGSDILNCCSYLTKKIQTNSFCDIDYECYMDMKQYYSTFFVGCF